METAVSINGAKPKMTQQVAQDLVEEGDLLVQGHVAAVSNGLLAEDVGTGRYQIALRITAALQKSLDVARLVEIFRREIAPVIAHDSVAYLHETQMIQYFQGQAAVNSCTYRLMVEDDVLGEIVFTRRDRFTRDELDLLEYLLCSLVYPLRNALEYKRVTEQAHKDPLTGVYNRGMLESVLQRETALALRHGVPFSIVFIDIDRFKEINDNLGHGTGDRAIKMFVDVVIHNMRATDMLARYGGDEFILVLSNTRNEGALLVGERLRRAIENDACLDDSGFPLSLTASLGVATLEAGDSVEKLVMRADQALQRAKQGGRNRVQG
jgi:diguanylate cyclase (GGDEF)-like protein